MKQVAIQGCQWEVDENGYMERGRFGRIRYKLHDTINIDNHIRTLSRLVTSTTPWHTESDFERAILYSCVNIATISGCGLWQGRWWRRNRYQALSAYTKNTLSACDFR